MIETTEQELKRVKRNLKVTEKALRLACESYLDYVQELVSNCVIEGGILSDKGYGKTLGSMIRDFQHAADRRSKPIIIQAIYDGFKYHSTAYIKDVPTYIGHFKTLKSIKEYAEKHYKKYEISYIR